MNNIISLIILLVATCHFGWAIVCGIRDKRLHNRYGPNLEVDFREEPIGFIGITILYIAIWCWLAYLTAVTVKNAYNFVFA